MRLNCEYDNIVFIDKGKIKTLTTATGQEIRLRLEVNPRARRLILRLDRKAGEAVAVAPSRRLLPEAAAFAEARLDWIIGQLDAAETVRVPLAEGAIVPLRGTPTRLTSAGTGRLPCLDAGDPQVLRLPGAEETLPARAERYFRRAAKEDLAVAVARHAGRLGVKWRRISIKDTRSRWGSCTADGNLAFSWRLILAKPDILDYVAAHEVAHLIEMNHSPAFWAVVERTCPDWRRARRWLRNEGTALHHIG